MHNALGVDALSKLTFVNIQLPNSRRPVAKDRIDVITISSPEELAFCWPHLRKTPGNHAGVVWVTRGQQLLHAVRIRVHQQGHASLCLTWLFYL